MKEMKPEFALIFERLRGILQTNAARLSVGNESANHYSLEGTIGPSTLKAWGGKMKRKTIPVAWVQIGKAYVSFHLMGIDGNDKLLDGMSKELKGRMQGKTCFNFKSNDDVLFTELEHLTAQSIAGFRKAGFIQ